MYAQIYFSEFLYILKFGFRQWMPKACCIGYGWWWQWMIMRFVQRRNDVA
jgi:hypothetical protein